MRILIIGSVAAGTSVAAKARRNSLENEIAIYEQDEDISYSSCGLPYYIGEDYISRDNLTPRNPAWFKKRFDIDIFTGHKVVAIDIEQKKLKIEKLATGEIIEDKYDKLVLATGAKSIIPPIEMEEESNYFVLRNVKSADKIKQYIEECQVKKAVIIGSGFIGMELLENLTKKNIETTIIEQKNNIMPHLDSDVSVYIEDYLDKKGIKYICGDKVLKISNEGRKVYTGNGDELDTDMIIMSTGVRPNTELVENLSINLGKNSGILVNDKMETNIKDIYAVGDCTEHLDLISGEYMYRPMGSTANKMGRIAGDVITGGNLKFRGILGTGIFKLFDMDIAYTGMTEKQARLAGYDIEVIHNIKENKSKYLKESEQILIKCIADKKTENILGVQVVGFGGVDKRIDVFVTAITFNAKVSDLFHLDLAYAPPFSTTKDPIMYTGMILDNAINNGRKILTVKDLLERRSEYKVIDVRKPSDYEKGHIEGAVNIPLANLKKEAEKFDKTSKIVVHCNKGVTGNAAQNLLINMDFEKVYNLSGGYKNYAIQVKSK